MIAPKQLLRLTRLATHAKRASVTDVFLASILAFVAGAANLGGLFAIGHFATHMTGYLSWIADGVVLREGQLVWLSLMALLLFFLGGIVSTLLLKILGLTRPHLRISAPVALQGVLLTTFATVGILEDPVRVPVGLAILCFTMGFQNAMISRISNFTIRTTHMTGLVTDLSVETGRWIGARLLRQPAVAGSSSRRLVLITLIGLFFLGGLAGSFSYRLLGFAFSLPFAMVLFLLAAMGARRTSRKT